MGFYFDVRRMGTSRVGGQEYGRAMERAETLLDYVNENYVLIDKREISGGIGVSLFSMLCISIQIHERHWTVKDTQRCSYLRSPKVYRSRSSTDR